jgi:hypothetical protein
MKEVIVNNATRAVRSGVQRIIYIIAKLVMQIIQIIAFMMLNIFKLSNYFIPKNNNALKAVLLELS